LVKNTIVQIDATPFRQFYAKHYGVELGKKQAKGGDAEPKSGHVQAKLKHRLQAQRLDAAIEEQFNGGRLLACISSRPGQTGRCDGYILEGDELHFYKKKLEKKKKN
jgi:small subunit ribosomal protein S8e